MKKYIVLLIAICSITAVNAQIGNVLKNAKKKVTDKTNNAVDKTIDNAGNNNSTGNNTDSNNTNTADNQNNTAQEAAPVSVTSYQNYDFRAGDKIIFEDNFA